MRARSPPLKASSHVCRVCPAGVLGIEVPAERHAGDHEEDHNEVTNYSGFHALTTLIDGDLEYQKYASPK